MRERLEALKAEWERTGSCHFPWDEVSVLLNDLDARVAALEEAASQPAKKK